MGRSSIGVRPREASHPFFFARSNSHVYLRNTHSPNTCTLTWHRPSGASVTEKGRRGSSAWSEGSLNALPSSRFRECTVFAGAMPILAAPSVPVRRIRSLKFTTLGVSRLDSLFRITSCTIARATKLMSPLVTERKAAEALEVSPDTHHSSLSGQGAARGVVAHIYTDDRHVSFFNLFRQMFRKCFEASRESKEQYSIVVSLVILVAVIPVTDQGMPDNYQSGCCIISSVATRAFSGLATCLFVPSPTPCTDGRFHPFRLRWEPQVRREIHHSRVIIAVQFCTLVLGSVCVDWHPYPNPHLHIHTLILMQMHT